MIENITGLPMVTEESPYKEESTQKLGRDDFLKMFLAQLSYQDPLNPMQATEFSVQLAQFSSLEQLFNVNDNLELLKDAQDQGSHFQPLDLIGKEVVADGNVLSLEEAGTSKGSFTLDRAAECTAVIRDANGYSIRMIPLGVLEPGQQQFEWDGHDDGGHRKASGIYSFEISAVTETGEFLNVETGISGQVTRVDLTQETPQLYVGSIPLSMSEIMEIRIPDSSQGSE
jgi:flagellar basal-body rod modification protein FlgD